MTNHALDKALERYNKTLEKQDINTIIGLIKLGRSIPMPHLETYHKNKCFHYVKYKHIPMKVLYLRSKGNGTSRIITIYPLDVDEYNEALEKQIKERIEKAIIFLEKNGYEVFKKERR